MTSPTFITSNFSPSNPFTPLLLTSPTPALLQSAYSYHRTARNATQCSLHLAPGFVPTSDPILTSILATPSTPDPRNCLVLWARPPSHIINLIIRIQRLLAELIEDAIIPESAAVLPDKDYDLTAYNDGEDEVMERIGGRGEGGVWWMPARNLHMTVMEAIHSVTSDAVEEVLANMEGGPAGLGEIADLVVEGVLEGGVRLGKPMVCFDGQAVAVSFLPLPSGVKDVKEDGEKGIIEGSKQLAEGSKSDVVVSEGWNGGYHGLRARIWEECAKRGINVGSRYVVPSAHVTVMRYVGDGGAKWKGGVKGWVEGVERVNGWLEGLGEEGEWMVGEERGCVWRKGRLWYGCGETLCVGKNKGSREISR